MNLTGYCIEGISVNTHSRYQVNISFFFLWKNTFKRLCFKECYSSRKPELVLLTLRQRIRIIQSMFGRLSKNKQTKKMFVDRQGDGYDPKTL